MKYIKLKTIGINPENMQSEIQSGKLSLEDANAIIAKEGLYLDYRETIAAIVKSSPSKNGGVDIDAMRKHIRILDALDSSEDGIMNIEDADYRLLKDLVSKHKWGVADRNILTFVDDITSAEKAAQDA